MPWKQEDLETIIFAILEKQPTSRAKFDAIRRKVSSKLHIPQPPNREVLKAYHNLVKKKRIKRDKNIEPFFQKAGIRSTSGIAVVTSLVKPYHCPGKCIYCPTEVRMPKSYLASEPAAARSLRLNFNPYHLMQKRIEMLERNGHPTDKIEYITKGGTWNAYPLKYQYWYIMESFKACNNLTRRTAVPHTDEDYWKDKPLEALMEEMEKEQRYNEKARHRIIGITLETRPDAISAKTIYHMRKQGCTRIELGLQAPDNAILALVKRGHTVEEFVKAMYLLREAGFKVDLHFMPDLPGTTPEHDVEMYTSLFENPAFKPDMVKIYPNTVIKTAELYEWFQDGRYTPYGDEPLFAALKEMKKCTPRYCRISRLIRDIPATEIEGGNIVTNLREVLAHNLRQEGHACQCLRCREISRREKDLPTNAVPTLFVDEYDTLGGKEFFITYEDQERTAVYGFLRLRIPHRLVGKDIDTPLVTPKDLTAIQTWLPEVKDCAFIRELHVYGRMVKIGQKNAKASQHKGLGKKLVQAAERIVKEHDISSVAVISGVGVRGYYRKLGYRKVGTYMKKQVALDT